MHTHNPPVSFFKVAPLCYLDVHPLVGLLVIAYYMFIADTLFSMVGLHGGIC